MDYPQGAIAQVLQLEKAYDHFNKDNAITFNRIKQSVISNEFSHTGFANGMHTYRDNLAEDLWCHVHEGFGNILALSLKEGADPTQIGLLLKQVVNESVNRLAEEEIDNGTI